MHTADETIFKVTLLFANDGVIYGREVHWVAAPDGRQAVPIAQRLREESHFDDDDLPGRSVETDISAVETADVPAGATIVRSASPSHDRSNP